MGFPASIIRIFDGLIRSLKRIQMKPYVLIAFLSPGFVFGQGKSAGKKARTWFVDIFIQVYSVNGQPVDAWTNEKGTTRHSGTYYYAKTVKKGDDGQAVHYRFNIETVNLKETKEGSLVFKSSTSEQIGEEKKELLDKLVTELPAAYSEKIEKKLSP